MDEKENITQNENNSFLRKFFNKTRVKALIQLGLFIIFFIFVFYLLNSGSQVNETYKDRYEFKNYNNYYATYEITKTVDGNDKFTYIQMSRFEDKYAIIIDEGTSLYVDEKGVYEYNETEEEFIKTEKDLIDLYNINPDKINTLISKGTKLSESNIINTEILKTKYEISDNFYISTYKKNNIINKVLIEYEKENESYEVEINYDEIGLIKDFDMK